jgi:hypothetical protein
METMQNTASMMSTTPAITVASTANTAGNNAGIRPLADITGLRMSGIFPQGKEPSVRTLREWTKRRRIPFHRLGHFVYYDIAEVAAHIRIKNCSFPPGIDSAPLQPRHRVRNARQNQFKPDEGDGDEGAKEDIELVVAGEHAAERFNTIY